MIDITTQLLILGGYLGVSVVVLMSCASILNLNANKRIDDFKDSFIEKIEVINDTLKQVGNNFTEVTKAINDLDKQIKALTLKDYENFHK